MKRPKTSASPTASGVDGGTAALSGFLYQMLGCAAVCAATSQKSAPDGPEYEVLVALAREREIYHEMHGQDAALVPLLKATARGTVLVQFKYSRSGDNKTLSREELIEIARRLAVSAKDVKAHDGRVSCCCLVTNRRLGPDAAKLLESAAHVAGLPKAVRDILKKLHRVERMDTPRWRRELHAFAERYGCLPPEIEDGIGKIVGDLFQQGAGHLPKKPLRLANLVKAFTNSADAKPLVRSEMRGRMQRELERLDPEGGGTFVRREILDRVVQETRDRALIVFAGRGGVGKTASLHAWASELSEGADGSVRPLIAATTAHRLRGNWPGQILSDWRNLRVTGDDALNFDLVVDRLKAANPDLRSPILHVCLDGLDEHANNVLLRDRIDEVVRCFLERDRDCRREGPMPTARLVVTCRSRDHFIKEWLSGSSGFTPAEKHLPPIFVFDEFTDREFDTLVRANLPPSLHERLLARAALPSVEQGASRYFDDGPVGKAMPTAKPAAKEVVDTLRDPAMWRSFLDLGQPFYEAVIDNEREARLRLGAGFVNRFCVKLERRTTLKAANVMPTLQRIAEVHRGRAEKHLTPDDWTKAALSRQILNPSQISDLLEEARSGGLVNDNALREWQWRNSIIEDSLRFLHHSP